MPKLIPVNSGGAITANHGIGHGIKAGLRNVITAFCTDPVGAICNPLERIIQQPQFLLLRAPQPFKYLIIFQINRLIFQMRRQGLIQIVFDLLQVGRQFSDAVFDLLFALFKGHGQTSSLGIALAYSDNTPNARLDICHCFDPQGCQC